MLAPIGMNSMTGFKLFVENRLPLDSPSLSDVIGAIHALTPHGGPGFLILEGPHNEFAQVAGGDGRYTAEWREQYGEGFCQWKAGLAASKSMSEAKVRTNGYVVQVQSNEVLSSSHAIAILTAFLMSNDRPKEFHWRAMQTGELSN